MKFSPQQLAKKFIEFHGDVRAIEIAEKYSVPWFKDKTGEPLTKNRQAGFFQEVRRQINKNLLAKAVEHGGQSEQ